MEWVPAACSHWPVWYCDSTSSNIYTTLAVFALSMSNKVIFTFVNINTTLAYLQKYQVVCTSHRITENSDQVRAMPDSSVLPVGQKKKRTTFACIWTRTRRPRSFPGSNTTVTYGYVTYVRPKATHHKLSAMQGKRGCLLLPWYIIYNILKH
jgi:hypothetical protein